MATLFPWLGGKSRQAARLCRLLPDHACYVEVFFGAGSVFFTKPRAKVEVINDIDARLVNLFRIARAHPRELIRQLRFQTAGRRDFDDYKAQPGLTDIQRAARTWFILKCAFGGTGGKSSATFGYAATGFRGLRRASFGVLLRCHRRLDGVYIENLDFADLIARYDRSHTLFFCDPPYWQTADYGISFEWPDHQRLAKALRSIKGRFLLTINDHPDIRTLYRGLVIRKVSVSYSVARDKRPSARNRTELIIANYPLPRQRTK